MNARVLANILLDYSEAEVTVRIGDDDLGFEVLETEEKVILLVEFPEEESPEDTRMFM